MGYLYLCFLSVSLCRVERIKQAQVATDTNIWVRGTRQAKHFIFVFRKSWNARGQRTHLYSIPTQPCVCVFVWVFVQCTQNWCQGMDDATLRTSVHVVLGPDERREQTHRCYVGNYYYFRVYCACLPGACHQPSYQRLQNETKIVDAERGRERESTCHVQKRCKVVSSSCVLPACGHSCLSTLNNFSNIVSTKRYLWFLPLRLHFRGSLHHSTQKRSLTP